MTTFCWLPPDSDSAGCSHARHADREARRRRSSTSSRSLRGVDEQGAGNPPRMGSAMFSRMLSCEHQPLALAVLRQVGDPAGQRAPGMARRGAAPPVQREDPAPIRVAPKIARASSVRPAPMRPAKPRISPACRSKLTSWNSFPRVKPRTDRSAAAGGRGARREHGREGTADHHADHLVRGRPGPFDGVDAPSVAEHGDGVADGEDLVDLVRDVQDRDAPRLQPADEREQALDLVTGERGGGLVHDEDLRVEHQRLADLDDLLVGHGEAARPGCAGRAARRGRPGPPHTAGAWSARSTMPAGAHRLAAQEDVLRHREVADHGELLEDGRHAVALGIVHRSRTAGVRRRWSPCPS